MGKGIVTTISRQRREPRYSKRNNLTSKFQKPLCVFCRGEKRSTYSHRPLSWRRTRHRFQSHGGKRRFAMIAILSDGGFLSFEPIQKPKKKKILGKITYNIMNGILLPGDSRWLSAASPSKLGPGALILAGSVASLYAHRQRRRCHLLRKFYRKANVSPSQGGSWGHVNGEGGNGILGNSWRNHGAERAQERTEKPNIQIKMCCSDCDQEQTENISTWGSIAASSKTCISYFGVVVNGGRSCAWPA